MVWDGDNEKSVKSCARLVVAVLLAVVLRSSLRAQRQKLSRSRDAVRSVRSEESKNAKQGPTRRQVGSKSESTSEPTAEDKRFAAEEKRYAAEVKRYRPLLDKYRADLQRRDMCLAASANPERCSIPIRPTGPGGPPLRTANGRLIDLGLSSEDAAYIAFARLRLTPPKPAITPSPNANRWKMAAVGYPLWLSVDGDTHPPAVRDAVADVSVSLEATVDHVVFSMGDRHSVTCGNVTTSWNTSIPAGKKSPTCGYRYERPSLPKGSYTVTATTYWSIAWSTSVDRGVIDFVQSDSVQLPVGELQVLVR